jgi:adenylosuccinate synthase
MSNVFIIIGLGFGDEGKGITVNSLCKNPLTTLVVRYNGGHQCGHTVVYKDIRHVFSNFGSGTLKGIPTYWTEYCTVDPKAVLKEGDVLRAQGIKPMIYFDANAMITTPYDIYLNLRDLQNITHGTVGVGFGTTIQRNDDHYHLYARDLLFPKIRDEKLRIIHHYSFSKLDSGLISDSRLDNAIEEFKLACDDLVNRFKIVDNFNQIPEILTKELIFEGGQGIMLDMDYGFFPNVTRSNTTTKNARALIEKWQIKSPIIKVFYVTRAYQTRHGNGYMTNEGLNTSYIKENLLETNINHGSQGIFRKSVLDLDLLKYALSCDAYNSTNIQSHLVVTCLDQVPEKFPITIDGELHNFDYEQIKESLDIWNVIPSYSDKGF